MNILSTIIGISLFGGTLSLIFIEPSNPAYITAKVILFVGGAICICIGQGQGVMK
jgi:hypothetical protein